MEKFGKRSGYEDERTKCDDAIKHVSILQVEAQLIQILKDEKKTPAVKTVEIQSILDTFPEKSILMNGLHDAVVKAMNIALKV